VTRPALAARETECFTFAQPRATVTDRHELTNSKNGGACACTTQGLELRHRGADGRGRCLRRIHLGRLLVRHRRL